MLRVPRSFSWIRFFYETWLLSEVPRYLAASFSGIALLITGQIVYVLCRGPTTHTDAASTPVYYASRFGEHRRAELTDGSFVELNTATAIAVTMTPRIRTVRLESGEALFTVHHESRPFRVVTGAFTVEAIGTAFDLYKTGHGFTLVITEGRVRVLRSPTGIAGTDYLVANYSAGQEIDVPDGPPLVSQ